MGFWGPVSKRSSITKELTVKTPYLKLALKNIKPRNPVAFLASARRAGRHTKRYHRQVAKKDLVQQLRDGAI